MRKCLTFWRQGSTIAPIQSEKFWHLRTIASTSYSRRWASKHRVVQGFSGDSCVRDPFAELRE